MTRAMRERASCVRETLGGMTAQIDALRALDDDGVRRRFEDEFGVTATGRSVMRMRRRLAWRIQAEAEGGLSQKALDRIAALAPPVRSVIRVTPTPSTSSSAATPDDAALPSPGPQRDRDPRLPPPGTVLRRMHKGVEHEVLVGVDMFEWGGHRFGSLSAVARAITGSKWNGYGYFRKALEAARGTL